MISRKKYFQKLLLVIFLLIIVLAASAGCQPREVTIVQTVEVTRLSEITVEVTRLVTVIVTMTNTPGPSPTPTITPTITSTATLTPTITPVNVSQCRRITFSVVGDSNPVSQLHQYNSQCISMFFDPVSDRALGFDYSYPIRIDISIDQTTYPDLQQPSQYGIIYGILDYPEGSNLYPTLNLFRIDPIPTNQRPVGGDILYNVGLNQRMSPGIWKSSLLPTDNDSCYWARMDPNTGDIRDNHFGLPGISVRLYEGDVFESTEDCGTWYYVGP
jgi:hypothetical protein